MLHAQSKTHPIIDQAIKSINFFSNIKYVFLLKDTSGNYLALTEHAAKVYGLENPNSVLGKSTMELFGEEHSKIAQQNIELDNYLLSSKADTISSINFFNYADNVQARLVLRYKLSDPESKQVLGILYQEIPSGLNNECVSIMDSIGTEHSQIRFPEYGANPVIDRLTTYEHEVCFLISIGWGPSQIHNFLNRVYPETKRSLDAIIKKKNAICNKFDIEFTHISYLREFLVQNGVYRQIPQNLLSHLQGSYLVQ